MTTFVKPLALGLGLMACVAIGAQAQTASVTPAPGGANIANLPPEGPRASSLNNIHGEPHTPIAKSDKYPGPDVGKGWYLSTERQTQPVQPSPQYVGPKPN